MPRIDSLPFRLQTEPGDEPVVCIDGLCGTGLHLSHWPGNETPAHLKHDLSTGIALNFARLDAAAQDALVGDAVAVINNHVDTDGCLALLATLRPEVALGHAQLLHEVAEAGDFFRAPSERSVGLDAAIEVMLSSEHSPWRERWRGCTPQQRHEQATLEMLSALPAILDGRDSDANELAQLALLSFQSDRADLASCALDELVHLSLQVWIAPYGASSTRAANDISGPPRGFDPGRHAMFGTTPSDRLLVLAPGAGGVTARLLIGTASWFDHVSSAPPPRPDLAALAARLNALEGSASSDDTAWRSQKTTGASPELWFGTTDLETFQEYAGPALRPSGLDPLAIKREVVEALRAAWTFPGGDEEEEGDWRQV